jgi:chorismate synthase
VFRLRFHSAGESHGPEVLAFLEGMPAGLALLAEDIDGDLARRQQGFGRGGRMKIERDRVSFRSGVRHGETIGSPIVLAIENLDYANWSARMSAAPIESEVEPFTRPRPGHADLSGGLKYDRKDLRDVLERASARETAARVAAGAVAKKFLAALGVDVIAHVVAIGPIHAESDMELSGLAAASRASDMACADPRASEAMKAHILEASHRGDTVGGVVEVLAVGCPPGLGSHVSWDRKLDGRLAQALMSIQAIKGVEIGLGFRAASEPGSLVHDPIVYSAERREFKRTSNGAGGIEGGISNGMPIVVRAAMKPISTLKRALPSVDIRDKQGFQAAHERSDICAVPAASVVAGAMVALVLADAMLEKFGGDSVRETQRNLAGYLAQIEAY